MRVSVIIPMYNSAKTISRCIDSILNQSYKDIIVYLIDDGSEDDTKNICMDYVKNYMNIKYLYKKNAGVSSARNYGIEIINEGLVYFIDSDDYIDSGVIEDLVKNYSQNVLPGILYKVENIEKISKKEYDIQEFTEDIIMNNISGFCWKYIYNIHNIKKENIQFDVNTSYKEDTLFLLQYIKKSKIYKVKFINNNNYYNYVNNANSITHRKNIVKQMDDIYYSLDMINDLTEQKFFKDINNRKIELLETELSLNNDKNERENAIKRSKEAIMPYIYIGKRIRYKIFLKIANSQILLKIYYLVRKKIKKWIGK